MDFNLSFKCVSVATLPTPDIQRTKKKTFADRSFSVAGPKLSNQLPTHIKSCDNYHSLPSAMKLRRLCFHRRMSVHRGVPVPGGCLLPGGSAPRGCLVREGLLPGAGGVPGPRGVPAPRGIGIPVCTEADTPRERRLLLRTVRILLECILV